MKQKTVSFNFKSLVVLMGLTSFTAAAVVPPAPSIQAKSYVLMDYTTGQIIASHDEHEPHGPASLTKIMTNYILGKELERKTVQLDDLVTISEQAWARNFPGSSLMFIEVGKQVSVGDLQRGLVISSGNDAAVAIAEHIAGSQDAFADLMNSYSQSLGMENSSFRNPHGLPAEGQQTTSYDMALLAQALIRELPEAYAIHSEKEFTFSDIRQYNRNRLLWDKSLQVDGVKTGYTSESGYSLVSSATDGDTRLITVVIGADSENSRATETKKLLNYGFRYYETIQAYDENETFVEHRIWGGDLDYVRLGVQTPVVVTLPKGKRQALTANFVLEKPLAAPLTVGETVGTVYLTLEEEDIAQFPLVALEAVNQGGFFKRMSDSLKQRFNKE